MCVLAHDYQIESALKTAPGTLQWQQLLHIQEGKPMWKEGAFISNCGLVFEVQMHHEQGVGRDRVLKALCPLEILQHCDAASSPILFLGSVIMTVINKIKNCPSVWEEGSNWGTSLKW